MILNSGENRSHALAGRPAPRGAPDRVRGAGGRRRPGPGDGRLLPAGLGRRARRRRDVDVVSLTNPGVEPHDLEPTFARTVALARADLVVVENGLQPAVDEAVEQDAEGRVLDVTDVVDRATGARSTATTSATSTPTSGRTRSSWPRSWTPWPTRWPSRPDHAETSAPTPRPARRARRPRPRLRDRAAGLRAEHRRRLAQRIRLLGRYGLDIEPISGLSPDAEPTPADLARLQRLIARTASPPSSVSGWSAPSWLRAWPTTWACAPRSSTRSRG